MGLQSDLREDQSTLQYVLALSTSRNDGNRELKNLGREPVTPTEAQALTQELNMDGYYETSALTGKGVKESMLLITLPYAL